MATIPQLYCSLPRKIITIYEHVNNRLRAGFKNCWFVLLNGELAYYDVAGDNVRMFLPDVA